MQLDPRNITVGIATFIVCGAVGYFVTKGLKGNEESPLAELQTVTHSEYHTNRITEQDTVMDITYVVNYTYNILGKDTISVAVDSSFEDKDYVFIPEPLPVEEKDVTTKPKVRTDERKKTDEDVIVPASPKMSKAEVKQMLWNGNIDYDKVSHNVRINVSSLRSNDNAPKDPMSVYQKKSTETWSDITVTDLKCDDKGNITSITVRPKYPPVTDE